MIPDSEWLNALLRLLQAAQSDLLWLLHALRLTGDVHGQPAWPFALRAAGETLIIDLGQARRLAWSLACAGLAAVLGVVACALVWRWRRAAAGLVLAAVALVLLAPWPDAHVVLTEAVPTSFHQSPTGFTAASVVRGQAVFEQHCAACHGADGRGRGPGAQAQAMWPPDLAGPLLWRRADGDLFWSIAEGLHDREGRGTMPAFGGRLGDDAIWSAIDFMKTQGAGQALQAAGLWPRPVAVPDFAVRCDGGPPRRIASWRGQRLRIVATGDGAELLEDGRLVTLRLTAPGQGAEGCTSDDPDARQALALVAGVAGVAPAALTGMQFIADRGGWLRTRGLPGKTGWTESDLLCRTGTGALAAGTGDGMGALIAVMDAEPVRYVKGGFVH
ncbi:c-type cytochrome [Xylophilus rhododendri]|uniref:c-type cytochrome n=1 Tax=Xylophilus rhododendri TaxID=2697032 RepID=UPI00389AAA27